MRLEKVELAGSRSVPDRLTVHVRPDLTCLIGANEHGKTNILDAINLLDGGSFQSHDKHVHSKEEVHPELNFTLRISPAERDELVAGLQEASAFWEGKPEIEDKTRALKIYERTIGHLGEKDIPLVRVQLRSDNSRLLHVDSFGSFNYPKPETKLGRWLNSIPAVVMFEPETELVDQITLADLKAGKNAPFEGLLRLAGVWDDVDVLFKGDNEAFRELIFAGRKLTRKLRKIWS